MSKSMRIAVLVGLALTLGSIFYFQYRFFRTPVVPTPTESPVVIDAFLQEDTIPAIIEPAFESVAAADVYLDNNREGIVVQMGRRSRFYPFQILAWHEVVNDTFGGRELLVTYAPLTGSAAAYDRNVGDVAMVLRASGKVADSNTLLIDDATGSLWRQISGDAIEGVMTGAAMDRVESFVTTWATFRDTYPSGDVLSRDTAADRDYTQDPYEGYDSTAAVWFPLSHEDARLPSKELVYGILEDGAVRAYSTSAYEARVDPLEPSFAIPAYWFAWSARYPESEIVE